MLTNAKRFVFLAAAALGILLVAVALAAVGERSVIGASTPSPVSAVVVNTAANPVPTTAIDMPQSRSATISIDCWARADHDACLPGST